MSKIPEIIRLMKENQGHHTLAKDANGMTVHPSDPNACAFCALGAIAKAYDLKPMPELVKPNPFYGDHMVAQQGTESFYKQLENIPLVQKLAEKMQVVRNERYADVFAPIYSVFDFEPNGPQIVVKALEEIEKEESSA